MATIKPNPDEQEEQIIIKRFAGPVESDERFTLPSDVETT
jgi:hypothetical protein